MLLEEGYKVVARFAEGGDAGLVHMRHGDLNEGIVGAIDLDGNGNVIVNDSFGTYLGLELNYSYSYSYAVPMLV